MKSKLLLLLLILLFSCSKEDERNDIDGGIIKTSEIVAITSLTQTLFKEEYLGIFQGEQIRLSKSLDNKLYFLVPANASLGMHDLIIPDLDNATIHYNILETVLAGTADEVIGGFNASLDAFSESLTPSPQAAIVDQSISSFKNVFANANSDDKTTMAILYQANRALFDELLLNDYSEGRLIDAVRLNLKKNFFATATLTVGLGLVYYSPDPSIKVFGLALFTTGAYKSREFYLKVADEATYTLLLEMDGVEGENYRNINSTLAFEDNVSKSISFNTKDRKIVDGDIRTATGELATFFSSYKKYNSYTQIVNEVIGWVNTNVPFANFTTIPLQQLPETSETTTNNVVTEIFSKIQFSTKDPNITIVSSALENAGQITIKIKINGNPPSEPLETFIHYTFKDGISEFKGKIPVSVASGGDQYTQILTNGSSRIWWLTSHTANGNDALEGNIVKYTFKSDMSYTKTFNGNSVAGGTFGFNVVTHKFYFNSNTNIYDFFLSNSGFEIDKSNPQINIQMIPLN